MACYTITNDFHNTSVTVRTLDGRLSARVVARVRRALCGIDGCTCGGDLSERGPQTVHITGDSTGRTVTLAVDQPPRYLVMTASACMPNSCWGRYGRVAVVELEAGFEDVPKMISTHARGVKRIVATWERQHVGSTDRCAFEQAIACAAAMVDELSA